MDKLCCTKRGPLLQIMITLKHSHLGSSIDYFIAQEGSWIWFHISDFGVGSVIFEVILFFWVNKTLSTTNPVDESWL